MRPRKMAYGYKSVPRDQDDVFIQLDLESPKPRRSLRLRRLVIAMAGITLFILVALVFAVTTSGSSSQHSGTCDDVSNGYQCRPEISHFWGQYSPFYSVSSDISAAIPKQCKVTFAQVLSRHGARDPTASKTIVYAALVAKIHSSVQAYPGKYAFLKDYQYTLGADQLTALGQEEMVNSGIKFYERYRSLARTLPPFVRSSGQARVVESATNFTRGYHNTREDDRKAIGADKYPYPIVVVSEADGMNNTLNHDLCTAFEDGPASEISDSAQRTWQNVFTGPIVERLNDDLAGVNLTSDEVILFMDLCPFNTVASPSGAISRFCNLFTEKEWHEYDYFQSLGKYYGYGNGNPLGPTQGVGYVNELIARLTGKPVQDHTSVNHTLDDSQKTFPIGIGHQIFADFSHDNDMTAIFAALGLYNATGPLSNTTLENNAQTHGYSASWSVPFAARAYFEKLVCTDSREELVRVLVNDRVVPLQMCGVDRLGRCKMSKFIDSLSFARSGGNWGACFV